MDAGTQGTREMLRYGQSRQSRSVKTSTGDISVADDAMGDWDFEGNGSDGRGKRWVLREHARQRLEVIASTEVPKDICST
jgi:hypothetical protein